MSQTILEMILRSRSEGTGVPKATQDLKALEKATGDFKDKYAGAMAGIGAGIGIIAAGGAAIVGLANKTADYARDVRDMARATGTSAEEASILMNVADDLQISFDVLKTAAREMNKDGIQPTLGNIKQLAQEYQAIDNPVDRAKFAMEHFGKAGIEMQKILEADVESLDDLAAGALSAGLVMDEEATEAALAYEQALDGLNDRIEGVKIKLGTALIPALTNVVIGFENTIKVAQALAIQFQLSTGMITQEEASMQAAALAGAGLTTETEALTTATEDLTTATSDADEATKIQGETYKTALGALRDFNIGEAQRLALEQAIKLASGELTQEEVERSEAIGYLTKQLELGNITQAEYITKLNELATGAITAKRAIDDTSQSIRNTPDRDVYIRYHQIGQGDPTPGAGDIGLPGGDSAPVITTNPDDDTGGSLPGEGPQSGAQFAPQFGTQSAGGSGNTAPQGGGGNFIVNVMPGAIVIQNASEPVATAEEILQRLGALVRSARQGGAAFVGRS